MTIYRGSRYEGMTAIAIKENSGEVKKFVDAPEQLTSEKIGERFSVHRLIAGETLDLLAYRYYGDETKWHIIAEANDIFFAYDIEEGQDLKIPDQEVFTTGIEI